MKGRLTNIHEDDAVFIFFAGHGITQKNKLTGEDLGYILPYDGTFERDQMYRNVKEEYGSLIGPGKSQGYIAVLNKMGFNVPLSGDYWSSTIHDYGPEFVWYLQIEDDFMGAISKEEAIFVWPVRSEP